MTIDENSVNAVILFLMHRKEFLCERLAPLLKQREELIHKEDSAFHTEIENQFEVIIRREVAEQIALDMQIDPESVFLVVETMNVKEFLDSLKGLEPNETK